MVATVSSMVSEVHMLSYTCSIFAGYTTPTAVCLLLFFFFSKRCFYHDSMG